MNSGEFPNAESVGRNDIRGSAKQVSGFEGGNSRDGGENVSELGSSSLYAIAMENAARVSLGIGGKGRQGIVKVDASGAEVTG